MHDISLDGDARRVRLRGRPVGLRQDDDAQHDRRASCPIAAARSASTAAPVNGPGPGSRRGVPVVRAVPLAHRARQRRVRAQDARRAQGQSATRSRTSTWRSPGSTHAADRYPNELSGGMQQRVGVVRALANEPDVLLMDEPFASVDAQTRMTLQEELTRIWQEQRRRCMFITHDVDEAVFLANRVVVLSKGARARRHRRRSAAPARVGCVDRGRRVQGAWRAACCSRCARHEAMHHGPDARRAAHRRADAS